MPSNSRNRSVGIHPECHPGAARRSWISLLTGVAILAVLGASVALTAQSRRDLEVSARRYAYQVGENEEPVIRVRRNDLVRITFSAEDIPHSFTIDEYRIGRRAEPGKPVTFEFRADREGRFEIYCNLTIDDRCRRELIGWLVVDGPPPDDAAR